MSMNRVLQLPLGATVPSVTESYTLGDVLICKANRGKQLEVETLVKTLHADVNYRNQVQLPECWSCAQEKGQKRDYMKGADNVRLLVCCSMDARRCMEQQQLGSWMWCSGWARTATWTGA